MENELIESTLAEVCSLVTDGTHDTPKRVASGFPLIKAKEITGGRIDFENCDQISEEEHLEVISRSKPEFGDTLFAHIGASLGEAAFVNTTREFSIKNVALFKPNPAVIDARYLYYLVISPAFQALAKGTKTGSAQPFLGLSQLRGHCIQYHRDLTTQRRIGANLSAYDELIENSQRRIRILEAMARALYCEWFVHFRFPGHEKLPRVASPLGDIPKGWEVRRVAEFAEFARGIEPGSKAYTKESAPNHIKFLRVGDLSKRDSDIFIPLELAEGRILEPLDIAITLDGSVGLVRLGLAGAYSTGVRKVVIGDTSRLGWSFAYQLLMTDSIQATIQAHAKGTTIKHAGTAVAALEFVSPPPALVEQFEKATAPMLKQVLALQDQIQNLRRTRDLLLPRLLSGQVELKTEAA